LFDFENQAIKSRLFFKRSWFIKINSYLCTPQSAFGGYYLFIKTRVFYANYSTVSSQRKNCGGEEK
jgi:hypothetical protein